MTYPKTYPLAAADQNVTDLAGEPCARLTAPGELARRLAELDDAYIRSQFVGLDALAVERGEDPSAVRALTADRRLPQPAYRLDDGTDMVPPDYFEPVDAAGGTDALREWFCDQYADAAKRLDLPHAAQDALAEWEDYLSGGYFVCLRHATPQAIAQKTLYITTIEALLAAPAPTDLAWAAKLRAAVEELAGMERPGSPLDPPRWGGPMSPQWYGAYLRAYFPQVFVEPEPEPEPEPESER